MITPGLLSVLLMLHFMAPVQMQPLSLNTTLRETEPTSSSAAASSTSETAHYASKAGLTCLLAIRRRILNTYKPLFEGFKGQTALLDAAAHTNVGGAIHQLKMNPLLLKDVIS